PISAFLVRVWRDGALFGATPSEAFYVKCDGEVNTAETIDAGQLIVEIGIAPVKPAEFVVFKIAQFSGGTSLSESGGINASRRTACNERRRNRRTSLRE